MLKPSFDTETPSFLARGWKLSLGLHFAISLGCILGPSIHLSSPPAEVVPIGIAFTDVVSEDPAPLGTPEGDMEETLPVSEQSESTAAENVPLSSLEEPQHPTASVPIEPDPLPLTAKEASESIPESIPAPAPALAPLPEPQPKEDSAEEKLQKASPPPIKPKEKASQKQKQKLDALVDTEESMQEDFLGVLKDVEKNKRKKFQKFTSEKRKGKAPGKSRKGIARGALQGRLSAGEEDFIRQQIYPHWSIPGGVTDAENLIVELRILMQEDGTVTSIQILDEVRYKKDPLYRAAAESAQRAVRIASPLKIPPNKLELLRSFRLRFDPKDALRL
ncbi:MAG: TonB C-terminal domain-containing protein [Holosporales bacterium]|jgi:outer membrane biosynthesis protein TonB|nr:TonB C-terminal domain-containing protein [Holosporales bacterium]